MPPRSSLYIDPEGVRRGYYVYLHRERESGTVFYVGKGHGKRAWDTRRRHSVWQERVAALGNSWDVEIVESDLSEFEAFELEEELVDKYGGPASTGGRLTNWLPGGEAPASVTISIDLGPKVAAYRKAYNTTRKFLEPPRKQQEAMARNLQQMFDTTRKSLSELEQQAEESGDEELLDNVLELLFILDSQLDAASCLLRRQIPWKAFALRLEESVDELHSNCTDSLHTKVLPYAKRAYVATKGFFVEIDAGNRAEAEEAATKAAESLRNE